MAEWLLLRGEEPIDLLELKDCDPENVKDVMRSWFFEHYEDPVIRTPYNSREGGYLYIYGGPYDALEELSVEFGNYVDQDVIEELSEELSEECDEWTKTPQPGDYEDNFTSEIVAYAEPYHDFWCSLGQLQRVLSYVHPPECEDYLRKVLYAGVVTLLETYLCDTFIQAIENREGVLRRYVESDPDLGKKKICVGELFIKAENIKSEVKEGLVNMTWHNLAKIERMYKSTLDVDFPATHKNIIMGAIEMRNHIIHRNGKNKEGDPIPVKNQDVLDIANTVSHFVKVVDSQVNPDDWPPNAVS